jgi:hypothetical protein
MLHNSPGGSTDSFEEGSSISSDKPTSVRMHAGLLEAKNAALRSADELAIAEARATGARLPDSDAVRELRVLVESALAEAKSADENERATRLASADITPERTHASKAAEQAWVNVAARRAQLTAMLQAALVETKNGSHPQVRETPPTEESWEKPYTKDVRERAARLVVALDGNRNEASRKTKISRTTLSGWVEVQAAVKAINEEKEERKQIYRKK